MKLIFNNIFIMVLILAILVIVVNKFNVYEDFALNRKSYRYYRLPNNFSGQRQYRKVPNAACTGRMIRDVGRMSNWSCQRRCDGDPRCNCVSKRKSDNMCRLKTGIIANGRSYWTRKNWNALLPKNDTEYKKLPNRSCGGNMIKDVGRMNAARCQMQCNGDRKCRCISHRKSDNMCRLESGPNTNRNSSWNAYVPDKGNKIPYCPHKYYTEFNPSSCNYPDNPYWCSLTPKPGHYSTYSECRTKFSPDKDNYDNEDFFKLIHEAYELSTGKNPKINRLKSLMNQVFRLACMLQANHDDYFEVKKCYGEYQSYNSAIFYEKVRDASKICRENKNSDKFLCNKFKRKMRELLDLARVIRGENNSKTTGCYCSKALAAQGKCVPC